MDRYEISEVVWVKGAARQLQVPAAASIQLLDLRGLPLTVFREPTGTATYTLPLNADLLGRIEGWVEAPDYDIVVTVGAFSYTQKVRNSPPGDFHIASYGAIGGNVGDQSASIQAAINACAAAGGGWAVSGNRTYRCLAGLTRPADIPVNIRGSGDASVWLFPNDLGADVFALGSSGALGGTRHTVRDLRLEGPDGAFAVGNNPSVSMDGVVTLPFDIFINVHATKFRAGIYNRSHHQSFYSCASKFNHYNLYYGPGDVNSYDDAYYGCDFTGARKACVAVAATGGGEDTRMGHIFFSKPHFGFAPYAFFKEAGAAAGDFFLWGVTMEAPNFESCGNAFIWDDSGFGMIHNVRLIDPTSYDMAGSSYARSTYYIASRSRDYAIKAWYVSHLKIEGHSEAPLSDFGAVGILRADYIDNVEWADQKPLVDATKELTTTTVGVTAIGAAQIDIASTPAGWSPYFGEVVIAGQTIRYEGMSTNRLLGVTGVTASIPDGTTVTRQRKKIIDWNGGGGGWYYHVSGKHEGVDVRNYRYDDAVACAAGDVLLFGTGENVYKTAGFAIPRGVAMHAATQNEGVAAAVRAGSQVPVNTAAAITNGQFLKPSGLYDGKCIAAAGRYDPGVFGLAVGNAAGGQVLASLFDM